MANTDKIIIKGARENNLKNIDIEIPKNKLVVMTGVSGSGKSSLAFDTIYAEGQRRYVESLSAYARQFIGVNDKPDVDSIEGLSPSISIDQKSTNKNPRSTVGTITEIYDYLRLLFARIAHPYCPTHHIPIKSQSIEEMTNKVMEYKNKNVTILAPVVHGEKGTHKDLFDELRKEGYSKVRVNGKIMSLNEEINLEKNIKDNIDIIMDKITVDDEEYGRIFEAIEASTKKADGKVVLLVDDEEIFMSEKYACKICNYSIPELEPRLFSFNAPYGACEECKGLGTKLHISKELLIPNPDKSIIEGAITALSMDSNTYFTQIDAVCNKYGINMYEPVKNIPEEKFNYILYGTNEILEYNYVSKNGSTRHTSGPYEGVIPALERRYVETKSGWIRDWLQGYMVETECPVCKGKRLQKSVLSIYINDKNIFDMTDMSIGDLLEFVKKIKLTNEEKEISSLILKEIISRLEFLNNVGLSYLTLTRSAGTLSGGEAQRIRLATQIGSKLSGVLYVLDEPSIGLHQKDNERLINSLKEMRNLGNSLIVVEHDTDTMLAADFLVDVGPGAGEYGGQIMAAGTPEEVMKNPNSLTGKYLSGELQIEVPKTRRKGNGKKISIKGAKENNLKNVNVDIPLNKLVVVTGVSGSGKSSLINEVLYKKVANELYRSKVVPGKCKEIVGLENIDKVIQITQDAIGRTPRSNPATYTGTFDIIRELFSQTQEAKMRGYKPGRFSFNVKGGRCEACSGDGIIKIEMQFLSDVYVPCEVCKGKRYNRETLEVKYKGKNIDDILNMTVEDALEFFENIPRIKNKLQTLYDVGLGYIRLGQPSTQLSGGEAQRIKLAYELSKRSTGKTMYILDEPTTGLHIHDVRRLIKILQRLVDGGNTVVVIEHNLDMIKCADYLIDLGPEGGDKGGKIVGCGTPEEICKIKNSYTGKYLSKYLE